MRLTSNNVFAGLVAACLLLQACTSAEEQIPQKEFSFKKERLYSIPISGNGDFIQQQFQQPGSEKVYFIDYGTAEFFMLNTANGVFRQYCKLPAIIQEADGFTVDEKARQVNIFFSDSTTVYSFGGKLVKTIPFFDPEGGYVYMRGQDFPAVFRNGKWYLAYFPKLEGEFKNPALFKAPVEAEVDLKTGKARLLPQSYPAIYREHSYGADYNPSRIELDDHTHGFVFPHSDSIYLCDIRTGELSVRFFGSKADKKLSYIPYKNIESLNETAFMDLVHVNPSYFFTKYAPLAGYFIRQLVIPPKKEGGKYTQITALFDKDLDYVGESKTRPGFLIDSRKGLLGIGIENNHLYVDKISW